MTNVNKAAKAVVPNGGSSNDGYRLGIIDSVAKAAQNDTFTVTNAKSVRVLSLIINETGAFETHTVSGNVVTMTSSTTGRTVKALIQYKRN
jgi:hypothetical protein